MAQPFYEFPWSRPEANAMYRALYRAVSAPARISLYYQQCAEDLPPLALGSPPDVIWMSALNQLTAAGKLDRLCEILLADGRVRAIHGVVLAFQGLLSPAPKQSPTAVQPKVDVSSKKRFAVAFSFAGEARNRVEPIARALTATLTESRILYDRFHVAEFAVPDLDLHLQKLYHDDSELIVVVICAQYDRKMWTGLEWRAIRDLINDRRRESIMFLRADDGLLEGTFRGDGYIDLRQFSDGQVAAFVLER